MGIISTLLQAGAIVNSILSQALTNGNSQLGMLNAPILADFLADNPLPNGFSWGTDTVWNTNLYTQSLDIGKRDLSIVVHLLTSSGIVRSYEFSIAWGTLAPDGYQKNMILINDARHYGYLSGFSKLRRFKAPCFVFVSSSPRKICSFPRKILCLIFESLPNLYSCYIFLSTAHPDNLTMATKNFPEFQSQ
jgi:hypothetical protein